MARYTKVPIVRKINRKGEPGKRNYVNIKYPEIPLSVNDTYVYATQGDRFDILALQYYGDSSLWWVISTANGDLPQNSYYLPLDKQIRIPSDVAAIIANYNALNGI
jgi:phage tail protein X